MQEEYIDIMYVCGSEKENACLGFGYSVEKEKYTEDCLIDTDTISAYSFESLIEVVEEFDPGFLKARKLIDEGLQTSVRSALYEVFGRLYFTVTVNDQEKELDCQPELENLIYDTLEEGFSCFGY